jgi:lycopene cyclase domain-containing protein
LVFGFTRYSGFNARWRQILPGLFLIAGFFIAWDAFFTANDIWGFNPTYHLPILVLGMPIEEWLFFLCIPFACLFIHDCTRRLKTWHWSEKNARLVFLVGSVVLLITAAIYHERLYTLTSFTLAGLFSLTLGMGALRQSTGHFLITFLLHCIPFFIVNGFLTSIPIVTYDDTQNLGIRMGTIPVEDLAYSLALIGLNVLSFEYLSRRSPKLSSIP